MHLPHSGQQVAIPTAAPPSASVRDPHKLGQQRLNEDARNPSCYDNSL